MFFFSVNPIAADYEYMFAAFPQDSDNWAQLLSSSDKNNNKVDHYKELLPSKIEELEDRLESVRQMSCSSRIDHSLVACSTSTPAVLKNGMNDSEAKVEEVAGITGTESVPAVNHVKCYVHSDKFAVTPVSGLVTHGTCEMLKTTSMYGVDSFEENSLGSVGSVFSRSCSVDGVVKDSTNGYGSYGKKACQLQ